MGLTFRSMEILRSSEFNSSNRSLYDYVNLNQSNESVYTNGMDQPEAATHSPSDQPTTVDRLTHETDQSMNPQTMKTNSSKSSAKVTNCGTAEIRHPQVLNNTVISVRSFAGELKCLDPTTDAQRLPTILNRQSERQLTSVGDPLFSYPPEFFPGPEYTEFSSDSVFQEPLDSEVIAGNRSVVQTEFGCSERGDRQLRPSTTSTDFSLVGSLADTSSQPDELYDTELNENKPEDSGRITLADYLESLDGSGNSAKLLRSIPQVAPVRRFPGSTGPANSDPLLVPNSTESCTSVQQFRGSEDQAGDTDLSVNGTVATTVGEAINGPSTGIMLMANGSSSSEKMLSNTSLPGATRSQSFTAPPDYLIKRRFFLLERLVERYDELLKLMNEELELTGRPPKHYLECMNAHKAAMVALSKVTPPTSKVPEPPDSKANGADKQSCDNQKTPGAQLPPASELRTTNRLQETRFLLSPKTVRKVAVKLSPSANNLLQNSHVSLCSGTVGTSGDTQSMGEPDLSNPRTALGPADRCPLHCKLHDRAPTSSLNTSINNKSDPNRRRYPIIGWNRRRQLGSSRGLISLRNSSNDTCANGGEMPIRAPSSDPTPLSISLSDLTCRCTNGFVQVISPDGDDVPDPDTEDLSPVVKRSVSITSMGCNSIDNSENADRAEALAWIEMELEAVRKILEANRKCASEPGRKRESRKAYQLVCQKNEQTIAQLERQRALLLQQSRLHGDSDKSSLGCVSHGGTDSLTSGADPPCDEPGLSAAGSEYGSEISASAAASSLIARGIRSVRSRLRRSSPSTLTSMVDGLHTPIPAASRSDLPRPPCSVRDRASETCAPSADSQVASVNNSKSQIILTPTAESNPNHRSRDVSSELNPTVHVSNPMVSVRHPSVVDSVDSFDERTRVPDKPLAVCAVNRDLTPHRELSSDTGLGASLIHSLHTESGSDFSRWSGHSMETNRSIISVDPEAPQPSYEHASLQATPVNSHEPTPAPATQVQIITEQSSRLIRLPRDETTGSRSNPTLSKAYGRTNASYAGRINVMPRVNVQSAVNHAPSGSVSKGPHEVEVHCSRLPAYQNGISLSNRHVSPNRRTSVTPGPESKLVPWNSVCQLPREITTACGTRIARKNTPSSVTQRSDAQLSASVAYTDQPRVYEFTPTCGENSAQTTCTTCYTILPKFTGLFGPTCSGRPVSRGPCSTSNATRRRPHRFQSECDYYSSGSILAPSRVQSFEPRLIHPSRYTNTPPDGRVLVHSRSGDLISRGRRTPTQNTLIKSSSGIVNSSSPCYVSRSRPFGRSRSTESISMCLRSSRNSSCASLVCTFGT